MEKYRDIPMDFADATLVTLAEETGIGEIFTLDIRGFSTYRFQNKEDSAARLSRAIEEASFGCPGARFQMELGQESP